MSWAIVNGQGITPKGCSETIDMMNLILEQVASPTLWQDTPEWEFCKELGGPLKMDLHAPSTIIVDDDL